MAQYSETIGINDNNNKYKLTISYDDDNIKFEIKDLDSISKSEYYHSFNLKELQGINRYFLFFLNIPEVAKNIINMAKNNILSIIKENNAYKIKIINKANDEEFKIEIPNKIKSNNQQLDYLFQLINDFKQKIENLEIKNKEIEKNNVELEKKLNNICPFPIGAVYTQFPGTENPKNLWKNTNWEIINFNGAFFRANGGSASQFNSGRQKAGFPNITGEIGSKHSLKFGWNVGKGALRRTDDNKGSSTPGVFGDDWYGSFSFDASRSNPIYGNSETVQPENFTVQIWKRTS